MSLFNTVAGYDPLVGVVLSMLGFDSLEKIEAIPRFRDAYVDASGEKPTLVIMTRTGGGNRDEYEEANGRLQAHPMFISDEDDDFDSTFAHFRFGVPDEHASGVEELITIGREKGYDFPSPMDRFQKAIGNIGK